MINKLYCGWKVLIACFFVDVYVGGCVYCSFCLRITIKERPENTGWIRPFISGFELRKGGDGMTIVLNDHGGKI
jgi:hypothetical protein